MKLMRRVGESSRATLFQDTKMYLSFWRDASISGDSHILILAKDGWWLTDALHFFEEQMRVSRTAE